MDQLLTALKETYPQAHCELTYNSNFQLLLAIMLSAQATDKKVNEITPHLFKAYPTAKKLAKATQPEIEQIIKSIGLYRTKAKNLILTSTLIQDNIPSTVEQLLKLPGVGRKTALAYLQESQNIVKGIVVDTHVAKFAKVFNLSQHQDRNKIEKDLQKIVPQKIWRDFTHQVIAHGRDCKYKKLNCAVCAAGTSS